MGPAPRARSPVDSAVWVTQNKFQTFFFLNVCIFSRSFQPRGETWPLHLGVVGCGFGFVGDNCDWREKVR